MSVVCLICTKKKTKRKSNKFKILNYLFILSFIITSGSSSVSKLPPGSFTGALLQKEKCKKGGSSRVKTEMGSIYAAPLAVSLKTSRSALFCI